MNKVGGLIITLHSLDIPAAFAAELTNLECQNGDTVAVCVIPFTRPGDKEELIALLSKMVQRDTLLDISKKS